MADPRHTPPKPTLPADIDDDFEEISSAPISNQSTQTSSNFGLGKRLSPIDLYTAATGLLEENHFSLIDTIGDPDSLTPLRETARIYRKCLPDGRLFILYYPGKDCDDNPELSNTALLSHVRDSADTQIEQKYTPEQIADAKKIFMIGESGKYLSLFNVAHWIKADVSRGVLTTEDSIDRNYDEKNINLSIPHVKKNRIRRGWQNMLTNDWACGYYVLEAIRRDIQGETINISDNPITQDIADRYFRLSEKSKNQSIQTSDQDHTKLPKRSKRVPHVNDRPRGKQKKKSNRAVTAHTYTNLANSKILLPVCGRLGSYIPDCQISISRLESAFSNHAHDSNLEIVQSGSHDTGTMNIRIYTPKAMPLLTSMGINAATDKKGHRYYPLSIDITGAKLTPDNEQPLLGLGIHVDGEKRYIDLSHVFSTNEIISMNAARHKSNIKLFDAKTTNQSSASPEASLINNKVFDSIRSINRYLKNRAQQTSGFLSFWTDSYSGADYYARRRSWKHILEKFNLLARNKIDSYDLKKFILHEADRFKGRFLSRTDYRDALINLANTIDDQFIPTPTFTAKTNHYYQLFHEMDLYHTSAKKYHDNYSWFGSNQTLTDAVNHENVLYKSHYDLLDDSDKNDFLKPEDERRLEYENTLHFHH